MRCYIMCDILSETQINAVNKIEVCIYIKAMYYSTNAVVEMVDPFLS